MQIRRVLAPCVALLIAMAPAHAQRNNDKQAQPTPQNQRTPGQQQDTEALVRLVEAVTVGQQPAPSDVPVTWESNHFVKGQGGDTYIPFTITVDRTKLTAPAAALYIRVVDKNKADAAAAPAAPPAKPAEGQKPAQPQPPQFAWDRIYFIDVPADGKLSRAIQLKPGDYDTFIAVKERSPEPPASKGNQRDAPPPAAAPAAAAAKMGLLRRDLRVPDYNAPELRTSSVILATTVEPMAKQLPTDQQEANPYVFGPMRIVPSSDGKFSKMAELQVIFWIYGAAEAAGGKPDVTIDYNFHQRVAGGEDKYFNRTQPQQLNAQTLPPEFSVAAGHQLPGSLVVPVSAFPAGDYRLEIKVTDKGSGKTVTENVNFTVLPV